MSSNITRPVYIDTNTDRKVHFVRYLDRKKGMRHLAAGFDSRDHSLEFVKNWIENSSIHRTELKLVENPVRCPDCGELVDTIFQHVDGC